MSLSPAPFARTGPRSRAQASGNAAHARRGSFRLREGRPVATHATRAPGLTSDRPRATRVIRGTSFILHSNASNVSENLREPTVIGVARRCRVWCYGAVIGGRQHHQIIFLSVPWHRHALAGTIRALSVKPVMQESTAIFVSMAGITMASIASAAYPPLSSSGSGFLPFFSCWAVAVSLSIST